MHFKLLFFINLLYLSFLYNVFITLRSFKITLVGKIILPYWEAHLLSDIVVKIKDESKV